MIILLKSNRLKEQWVWVRCLRQVPTVLLLQLQNIFCFLGLAFIPIPKEDFQFSSVAQSCPTLRPHGLQHARLPCPSPTPGACSDSWPTSGTLLGHEKNEILTQYCTDQPQERSATWKKPGMKGHMLICMVHLCVSGIGHRDREQISGRQRPGEGKWGVAVSFSGDETFWN